MTANHTLTNMVVENGVDITFRTVTVWEPLNEKNISVSNIVGLSNLSVTNLDSYHTIIVIEELYPKNV